MRIVLVRPPFVDKKYGPPIGLAYLSNVLKNEGHDVAIIDINVDIYNNIKEDMRCLTRDFILPDKHPAIKYAFDKIDIYCDTILNLKPDIVGFHLTYPTVEYGNEMAKRLSRYVRCIAGGPQASYNEDDLLNIGCYDTVVSGYGEEAILEVMSRKGIISKDLDQSKNYLPDYSAISLDNYDGIFPVITTRGCPNSCTFCTQNQKYYYQNIETVLKQIAESPSIKLIMYNDSNINVNTKRTIHLFDEISKLKIKRPGHIFGMQVKDDYQLYVHKMAQAGVCEVRIGIESGSFRERCDMNKPKVSNELIVKFIKELASNNIMTFAQYIFCYPSQTDDDRRETLELIHRINFECGSENVKHNMFKFMIHHGKEELFLKKYNVVCTTPQHWQNDIYDTARIQKIYTEYSKLLPTNCNIFM